MAVQLRGTVELSLHPSIGKYPPIVQNIVNGCFLWSTIDLILGTSHQKDHVLGVFTNLRCYNVLDQPCGLVPGEKRCKISPLYASLDHLPGKTLGFST